MKKFSLPYMVMTGVEKLKTHKQLPVYHMNLMQYDSLVSTYCILTFILMQCLAPLTSTVRALLLIQFSLVFTILRDESQLFSLGNDRKSQMPSVELNLNWENHLSVSSAISYQSTLSPQTAAVQKRTAAFHVTLISKGTVTFIKALCSFATDIKTVP